MATLITLLELPLPEKRKIRLSTFGFIRGIVNCEIASSYSKSLAIALTEQKLSPIEIKETPKCENQF